MTVPKFVVVAAALLTSGCGYLGAAVAVAASSGGGSSGATNSAPIVSIDPPLRQTGDIDITYTLTDVNDNNADVTIEYAVIPYPGTADPSPGSWLACTRASGEPTMDLTATKGGSGHTFTWDAPTDLGDGVTYSAAFVRIRITPMDTRNTNLVGTTQETSNFVAGNDPPTAVVTTPSTPPPVSGLIQIDYTLSDSTDDLARIQTTGPPPVVLVDFSTDSGSTWATATVPVGAKTNLATAPGGIPHTFAWDSIADVGVSNSDFVQIRITPLDDHTQPGQEVPARTNDFQVRNNTPPLAFIASPVNGQVIGGDVVVQHRLFDLNFPPDLVDIDVEYSIDGGNNWAQATECPPGICTSPPSDGTTALTSSDTGVDHVFVWDSGLDLPDIDLPGPAGMAVRFRITPSDLAGVGTPHTTIDLRLDNNLEPTASVSTPPSPQVSGSVPIVYALFDPESDTAAIDIEYSTDSGGTLAPATEVPGFPSEGVTGLSTSPGGDAHTFVWNALADLGQALVPNVVVRITPRDHSDPDLGRGQRIWTDVFVVDNTIPPTAAIDLLSSPSAGMVLVDYTLFDMDAAPIDVAFSYSTNGALGPFTPATRDPAQGDGVTGLASLPSGVSHVFAWNTLADLGPALETNVVVRLIPSDTKTGTPVESSPLTVDNNEAPEVEPATPVGVQSGNILIPHTLYDSNGDPVSIQVQYEYSMDGGATYTAPATATECTSCTSPPSDGISGLTSSPRPAGTSHNYIWDSVADISLISTSNVRIIFTPSDTLTGSTVKTLDFAVDNGSLVPVVLIDPISRSYPLNVTIPYRILDGDGDPATIVAEFTTDGTNFAPMTILSTSAGSFAGNVLSNIPTSSSGLNHSFVWDSAADLPPPPEAVIDIQVRLSPSDGDGTGAADTSNPFTRGNDAPAVAILTPFPSDTVSGLVRFQVRVDDSTSDPVDLTVTYDIGGGPAPAQITVGSVSALPSSPSGTIHTFAWNSIADLGIQDVPIVRVEITPADDEPRPGLPQSVPVTVQNNDLPVAFIGSPTTGDVRNGPVNVAYFLVDGNSDPIDCTFEYSIDGANYVTAAVGGGDGSSGLASSPDGIQHLFIWASDTNIPSADQETVTFRITPDDLQNPGPPFTSETFLIDNNDEPSVTISFPGAGAGVSGTVLVDYTAIDTEQDPADIRIAYSPDGGLNFFTATADPTEPLHEGTASLSTVPGLNDHIFAWNSAADLPGLNPGVVLRIVASDHPNPSLGDGPAAQTSVFTVDNTIAPQAVVDLVTSPSAMTAPPDPVFGKASITYRIIDPDGDPASIQVKFWIGGAPPVDVTTWPDATLDLAVGDGTANLNTSPTPGTTHTIGWATEVDLPGYNGAVSIAVIATDSKPDPDPFAGRLGPIVVNNTPVAASGDVPGGILYDRVAFRYRLVDLHADSAGIAISYSTGGTAGPFLAATEAEGAPSEGTVGLSTSVAGDEHVFVWNSYADVGEGNFTDVILQIVPTEESTGRTGQGAFSSSFRLDNRVIATISGSGNGDGGDAKDAWLDLSVYDCAIDPLGNVYFSEWGDHRVRRIHAFTGTIETVAGNGVQGFSGDGGPAHLATLNNPRGITIDANRNLYIADYLNQRVRKVDGVTGIITTIAGGGASNPGNGGPATDAVLARPHDIAFASTGEMYITENWQSERIRVVDAGGTINAFAGTGTAGFSGDTMAASAADLDNPSFLAIDANDNVFFTDWQNRRVRWVNVSTGIIDTYAGDGNAADYGDTGPANLAALNDPKGIAFDDSGNLYISVQEAHRIRVVDSLGTIDAFAGTGTSGFSGDGGPALSAQLSRPQGVAWAGGDLYICGRDNRRIRTVDGAGTIRTLSGNGFPPSPENVAAISAFVRNVYAVATDSQGNIYHIDGNRVRKVDARTGLITTVAGAGPNGWSGDGFPATGKLLCTPQGLAIDSLDRIFIGDTYNHRVRIVDTVANTITTFAGRGACGAGPPGGFSGDGLSALSADLNWPKGIGFDGSGNVYIADSSNHCIRVVDSLGTIDTFAGTGTTPGYGGDLGPATAATMRSPDDVTATAAGVVYIADTGNHAIRIVDTLGDIDTFAGTGSAGYSGDGGPAQIAVLSSPRGVAVHPLTGDVYVADSSNHRIRMVDGGVGTILTIAGLGAASFGGDGGPPTEAFLSEPRGICVDAAGIVFFTDFGNDRVRRF